MNRKADTFEALYRAHAPSVFRRAKKMLGSDADAHEIVSDVFLSLYERPEQYRGRSSLSTFLYAMTTNACLNRLRMHKQRSRAIEKEGPAMPHVAQHPLPPDRTTQLRRTLERMPEPLAHVAVYYYLDELTQEEIAAVLGCSRRHVVNLLARLDAWCRAELGESEGSS